MRIFLAIFAIVAFVIHEGHTTRVFTSMREAQTYAETQGQPDEEIVIDEPGQERKVLRISAPDRRRSYIDDYRTEAQKFVNQNLELHRKNLKRMNNIIAIQNQGNYGAYKALRSASDQFGTFVRNKTTDTRAEGLVGMLGSLLSPVNSFLDSTMDTARVTIDDHVGRSGQKIKSWKTYTKPAVSKSQMPAYEDEEEDP